MMHGMLFRELLHTIDLEFSPAMTERVIRQTPTATGGAYTRVGMYDRTELFAIAKAVCGETGVSLPDLFKKMGGHMASHVEDLYPELSRRRSLFEFLSGLDEAVSATLRHLYPRARMPELKTSISPSGDTLILRYVSQNAVADVMEGLIRGLIVRYAEAISLDRKDEIEDGKVKCARYSLKKL